MSYRLLVPVDGTPGSERVLPRVQEFAGTEAEVYLLNILPKFTPPVGMPPTRTLELCLEATEYLRGIRRRLPGTHGPLLLTAGGAADCIARVVAERRISLVLVHDLDLADALLRRDAGPVCVIPEASGPPRGRVRRILVPLHGWAWSRDIVDDARRMAQQAGAEIVLLHVVDRARDPLPATDAATPIARLRNERRLQEIADQLEAEGIVAWPLLVEGRAADRITEQAERLDADLIAMPTHARTWAERLLSPSISAEVLRSARRPVLLQKAAAREPLAARCVLA